MFFLYLLSFQKACESWKKDVISDSELDKSKFCVWDQKISWTMKPAAKRNSKYSFGEKERLKEWKLEGKSPMIPSADFPAVVPII